MDNIEATPETEVLNPEIVQPVDNETVLAGKAICPQCMKPVLPGERFFRTGVHLLQHGPDTEVHSTYAPSRIEKGARVDVTEGWMVTHFSCYRYRGRV